MTTDVARWRVLAGVLASAVGVDAAFPPAWLDAHWAAVLAVGLAGTVPVAWLRARPGLAAAGVAAAGMVALAAFGAMPVAQLAALAVAARSIGRYSPLWRTGVLTGTYALWFATPGMPPEGARQLTEIGDTARAALTDMRRLLGILRAEDGEAASRHPQPGLADLGALVEDARASHGAELELLQTGDPVTLDAGTQLAIYRVVQEALTNARRHSPGASHVSSVLTKLGLRDRTQAVIAAY